MACARSAACNDCFNLIEARFRSAGSLRPTRAQSSLVAAESVGRPALGEPD
jgi:hypothetical protein